MTKIREVREGNIWRHIGSTQFVMVVSVEKSTIGCIFKDSFNLPPKIGYDEVAKKIFLDTYEFINSNMVDYCNIIDILSNMG